MFDPHNPSRAWRVDEPVVVDDDADVGRSFGDGLKEDEIPDPDIFQLDLLAYPKLLARFTRQRDAVLREHVLREAAAVETVGIRSAVPVRHATQAQRRIDERRVRRWGRRGLLSF